LIPDNQPMRENWYKADNCGNHTCEMLYVADQVSKFHSWVASVCVLMIESILMLLGVGHVIEL
jgi:hypothetical protein